MAEVTARRLADVVLVTCYEHGDWICNLKLQKILYYAQGWFLGLYSRPLFDDPIEAWIHGPVVPSVYHEFKSFSYRPIVLSEKPNIQDVSETVMNHITELWASHGSLSGYELELASHQEAPWLNARKGLPPDCPSTAIISIADIREYFSILAHEKAQ